MKPAAGALAHVVTALGADVGVALQLCPIEHRIALRALRPHPFGNGAPAAAFGTDPRRQQPPEPAHDATASIAPRNSPTKSARTPGIASAEPAFRFDPGHDRAPDHHGVADPGNARRRGAIADPEPHSDGEIRRPADSRHALRDLVDVESRRAGDSLQGDVVDEPARLCADSCDAFVAGRGRDQKHRIDLVCAQLANQILGLLGRQIHGQEAVDARCRATLRRLPVADRLQWIEIAHQHHGSLVVDRAELAHDVEDPAEAHSRGERPLAGALDHRAVRHRVGEGDSQLDDVRARRHHRMHHRDRDGGRRIAGGDEWNQGGPPPRLERGEPGSYPTHR